LPAAQATPATPSEADVTRWSHDAIEAFDRGDAAALGAALSAGFLQFEGSSPMTRDDELAMIAKRKPGSPQIARRAWSSERVSLHEPYAVFIGEAKEHAAGNDVHGGSDYDGWYTLVWSRDGDAYKLAYWSWKLAGAGAQRDFWNATFRGEGTGFSKEPSHILVETVAKLRPGTALDVAMGQGRNALYLASRGWKVTGVDFSDEGVRLAHDAAAARHLTLDAVNADLDTYDFGADKWDLVTFLYVPKRPGWVERAQRSVKHGGLFVLEFFHREDGEAANEGFATGELSTQFKDGWEILRDEVADTTPDWAADHAKVVRFVAKRK
jgi:SAM-dependent methyltransferase